MTPGTHTLVAIQDSAREAEAAVGALQRAGLNLQKVSIMGRDFHTEEASLGFQGLGDRAGFWAEQGTLWGGLWSMLFGGAFFYVTTIGSLVVMGPLIGWLVDALEGGVFSEAEGSVVMALTAVGLPKACIVDYEAEVKAGRVLVLARGSAELVEQVHAILVHTGTPNLKIHAGEMTVTRVKPEVVLGLLSDGEVKRLSSAETALRLSQGDDNAPGWVRYLTIGLRLFPGDEYLDLERLDLGVQCHGQSSAPTVGRVLPRKAVHEKTWSRIVAVLAGCRRRARAA